MITRLVYLLVILSSLFYSATFILSCFHLEDLPDKIILLTPSVPSGTMNTVNQEDISMIDVVSGSKVTEKSIGEIAGTKIEDNDKRRRKKNHNRQTVEESEDGDIIGDTKRKTHRKKHRYHHPKNEGDDDDDGKRKRHHKRKHHRRHEDEEDKGEYEAENREMNDKQKERENEGDDTVTDMDIVQQTSLQAPISQACQTYYPNSSVSQTISPRAETTIPPAQIVMCNINEQLITQQPTICYPQPYDVHQQMRPDQVTTVTLDNVYAL